jgi:hypothetical protein
MIEGYLNVIPELKSVKFEHRGKIDIYFEDGRIIILPVSIFPSIKKLNSKQRKKIQLIGKEGFTFDECDEVFHIEQILGRYDNYKHN